MTESTRLWQLSDGIQQLENALANIQEDETFAFFDAAERAK